MSVYKIYKEGDEDQFYIGSTNDFSKRKYTHKIRCKTRNHKLYNYINENGGWECFKMQVLEYCLNYEEREIELIKQLQPSLNSNLYNWDSKKYREENKDKISERNKKYREENKEIIKQKRQIKSEENKEYRKKYWEENKDELNEKKKKYREENRDKLNEKIICDCGCITSKSNIARHRKSKKHIELMK